MLSQAEDIKKATSTYINDLFINEDIAFVNCVVEYLLCFRLTSKDLEQPKARGRILELPSGGRMVEM